MAFGDTTNDILVEGQAGYEQPNNPLATPNTMTPKGLRRIGANNAKIQVNLLYAVQGGGASINFTQQTALADLLYYTIRVSDEHKNEASGQINNILTTVLINIDTSSLDPSDKWSIELFIDNTSISNDTKASIYEFKVDSIGSDPTATVFTGAIVGTLAVTVDGVSIASGGSHALAGASVGDVIVASLVISQAMASAINTIVSVLVTGDGTFDAPGSVGHLPTPIVQGANKNDWKVLMDTSGAGAKTAIVAIISDDAATPYIVDITLVVS